MHHPNMHKLNSTVMHISINIKCMRLKPKIIIKIKIPNFRALQLSPPYRNFVLEISRKELGISRLHIRLQLPCSLLGLAISP